MRARSESELFLSVVTLGEVERGIERMRASDPASASDLRAWIDRTVLLFEDRILAFGAEDAVVWGRLSAAAGHDGADLMIAAQALTQGMTVVTRNVSHFAPTGVATHDPF